MDAPAGFLRSVHDTNKLEAIIPCVGFDDLLDVSLGRNLPHLDHCVVVTSPSDHKTIAVCRKWDVMSITTDVFERQGKTFSKGAGIQLGLGYCQFGGWRLVLDADILLPDNFRRVLLNHTHLDVFCLYGADRVDVAPGDPLGTQWGPREEVRVLKPLRSRVVTKLCGYLPLGYFQLFHSSCAKEYPSSEGGAGLDDVLFSQLWPMACRRLLPSVIVYHLCASESKLGENWDGVRRSKRLDEEAV